jgi:hypothetical protein
MEDLDGRILLELGHRGQDKIDQIIGTQSMSAKTEEKFP